MLITGYFIGKLKDKRGITVISNIDEKKILFMVFKCSPLEQTSWFTDSVPAAGLLSHDSPSYLPNCSLGLAIFTCASSLYFSRE